MSKANNLAPWIHVADAAIHGGLPSKSTVRNPLGIYGGGVSLLRRPESAVVLLSAIDFYDSDKPCASNKNAKQSGRAIGPRPMLVFSVRLWGSDPKIANPVIFPVAVDVINWAIWQVAIAISPCRTMSLYAIRPHYQSYVTLPIVAASLLTRAASKPVEEFPGVCVVVKTRSNNVSSTIGGQSNELNHLERLSGKAFHCRVNGVGCSGIAHHFHTTKQLPALCASSSVVMVSHQPAIAGCVLLQLTGGFDVCFNVSTQALDFGRRFGSDISHANRQTVNQRQEYQSFNDVHLCALRCRAGTCALGLWSMCPARNGGQRSGDVVQAIDVSDGQAVCPVPLTLARSLYAVLVPCGMPLHFKNVNSGLVLVHNQIKTAEGSTFAFALCLISRLDFAAHITPDVFQGLVQLGLHFKFRLVSVIRNLSLGRGWSQQCNHSSHRHSELVAGRLSLEQAASDGLNLQLPKLGRVLAPSGNTRLLEA